MFRRHRLLRQYQFSGELTHGVTVPAGPDGRPGERLLLPSRNAWNSEISRDGARNDCQAILSRRGSLLLVVCLGPVSERRNPWESAHYSIDAVVNRVQTRSLEGAPERTKLAGEDAVKYVIGERNGRRQHEWKLARNGWLYAAGILVQPGDD